MFACLDLGSMKNIVIKTFSSNNWFINGMIKRPSGTHICQRLWLKQYRITYTTCIYPMYISCFIVVKHNWPHLLTCFNANPNTDKWLQSLQSCGWIFLSTPNLYCAIIEVWEWISSCNPHFTGHEITYPWSMLELKLTHVSKTSLTREQ